MQKDLNIENTIVAGVISDTHGKLSAGARSVLSRADLILHAGDVDTPDVLTALESLAPVTLVRGNMDYGRWAANLPVTDMFELGGLGFYMLHNLHALDLDPSAAGVKVVISGHTHQAAAVESDDVMFLNPGSSTAPRHGSEASVALLTIVHGKISYRFYEVE